MKKGPDHRAPENRIDQAETQTLEGTEHARHPGLALPRGMLLGRYVVLHALGTGGMGSVYAAFDPELDRKVAVKVLRHDHQRFGGAAAQARLRREAQAIAKLAHPNVVVVHDVGTVGERLFVAMECIDGATLADWQSEQRRNWRQVVEVFLQAGRGLAAAHEEGLIHRDFKPSNVMVGVDGRVRVLDFGLARDLASARHRSPLGDSADSRPHSHGPPAQPEAMTSRALGTPAYIAPELLSGESPDARSDQYSFCLSLYESLNGELPGEGSMAGPTEGSRVPGWLRRLVSRGLSPQPAMRFPSMGALLAVLERGARQRHRQWMAAALVVVVVLTLGLYRLSRTGSSTLCKGAERRLEGIWDEPRRAAGFAAFEAVGKPFATETWRRVAATLDSYTDAWTRLHAEACEATHLRGEQSTEMLDLRMACLDRRLQELEAVTDLLLEADEQVALNATKLGSLPGDLGLCSDREALMADFPPPPDTETATRVNEIRALIDEARALDNIGKYQDAYAVARSAVDQATGLGYPAIRGEALFRLSQEAARTGQRAQMAETLLEVAKIALASDHDELVARSYTHFILAHWLRGEGAEARKWAELAEGAIERLSRPQELISQRLFFLGMLANTESRPEEAVLLFERSMETNPNVDPFDHLATLNNLGVAYRLLGQLDKARANHQESVEVTLRAYGPDHPALAGLYADIGDLSLEEGDFEEALLSYRRSHAIRAASTSADDPHRAFALTGIGRALIDLSRPAEALGPLEEAVRLRQAQTLDPGDLAFSHFQLARALWDSGVDRSRARALVLAAREVQRTLGERASGDLEKSETWLAEHP